MVAENFKILIVETHAIVEIGLMSLVSSRWGNAQFLKLDSLEEFKIKDNETPDVIILEINMLGAGIKKMFRKIAKKFPSAKTLIFTWLDETKFAVKHLKYGATGFLSKNSDAESIITAITSIINGGKYYSDAVIDDFLNNQVYNLSLNSLSQDQKNIIQLLGKRLTQ